ncbi:MAG: YchJ family protein [Candidatus Sericytochromatia bacterium]|nr:YchJ family protein [Candidatus Sericytochromatia bacterium]
MIDNQLCPCGTKLFYSECCEPIIKNIKKPLTAEKLMRSRYSAYAKTEILYLLETTHYLQRHLYNQDGMRKWSENSEWQNLEIIATKDGNENDLIGEVEFIAHYLENGEKKSHHELSFFKKEDDKWYFDYGITPNLDKKEIIKLGRNEPCFCGSDKKFKKCCGKS